MTHDVLRFDHYICKTHIWSYRTAYEHHLTDSVIINVDQNN